MKKIYFILLFFSIISAIISCKLLFSSKVAPFRKESLVVITNIESENFIQFENDYVILRISKELIVKKYKTYKHIESTVFEINTTQTQLIVYDNELNCKEAINSFESLKCIVQEIIVPDFLNTGSIRMVDKTKNQEVSKILKVETRDEKGWHKVSYFLIENSNPFFVHNITLME